MYVPYVTFKTTAHPPNKKAALTSTSNVTPSHDRNSEQKKKKSQRPSLTRWYPCSPKAEAFLFFGVWLQTFLPASSKSNNKPSVPWERRGGWARRERGIRHRAYTRGQSVGRENAQRNDREKGKRTMSRHLKGVFSSATRVPTLWERWRVKQKRKMQRGKKNKKKNPPCLLSGLEAGGMCLKALGLLPKKTFSTISKGHNQLRGSGGRVTVVVESNLFFFFFVSN